MKITSQSQLTQKKQIAQCYDHEFMIAIIDCLRLCISQHVLRVKFKMRSDFKE